MLDLVSKKSARIRSEQMDRKSTHYVNLEGASGFELSRTPEACFLIAQERYCSQQVVVGTYEDPAEASRDYTDLTKAWERHRKGMSGEGGGLRRSHLALGLLFGLGMGAFGTTFFSRLSDGPPPLQAAPASWVPRPSRAETPLAFPVPTDSVFRASPITPAPAPQYAGPPPRPAPTSQAPSFGLEAN